MELLAFAVSPLVYFVCVFLGLLIHVFVKATNQESGKFEFKTWFAEHGAYTLFSLVAIFLVAQMQVSNGGILTAAQGVLLGSAGDSILKNLIKSLPFSSTTSNENYKDGYK